MEISPCALVPNSWRYICGFTAACALTAVDPSALLFRLLFTIKNHPGARGWWYVTGRRKKGVSPLIQGAPTAVQGWKQHFFFVSRSDGKNWGFASWDELQDVILRELWMDDRLRDAFNALHSSGILDLKELLSEKTLFNIGISSIGS